MKYYRHNKTKTLLRFIREDKRGLFLTDKLTTQKAVGVLYSHEEVHRVWGKDLVSIL